VPLGFSNPVTAVFLAYTSASWVHPVLGDVVALETVP
jgi:hypothetical protein